MSRLLGQRNELHVDFVLTERPVSKSRPRPQKQKILAATTMHLAGCSVEGPAVVEAIDKGVHFGLTYLSC